MTVGFRFTIYILMTLGVWFCSLTFANELGFDCEPELIGRRVNLLNNIHML